MADIFEEVEEMEFEVVTMIDEDGDEIEFSIIDHVASGGERYLLVVETSQMDEEESEAFILKEESINTDDVTYAMVEDEAEFDRITAVFAQRGEEYTLGMS